MMRTFVRLFLLVLFLLLLFPKSTFFAQPQAQSPTLGVNQKIDPEVLTDLQQAGKTTFFVVLGEQANTTHAADIADWEIRGQVVVDSLREVANRTQRPILNRLVRTNADVTPFWIVNTIKVTTADENLLRELAARPDVALIKADEMFHIPEPLLGTEEPKTLAVEWNVARVKAPDVWAQFGVRGETIVVANIDTGVQYNHPALVMQYRGRQPNGTFDHNYNWHDPSRVCGNPSLVPCDNNGHGTHTMGTIAGDDRGSNQIGVAPGARWIAAKGCETSSCSLTALLSSGQWMLAPTNLNGQNPRADLRPHIVNNSWGSISTTNTFYRTIVQNWRNSGIFPVFSNGNSGPGCGSAGVPAAYPESLGVGATNINDIIAGFSSRGPATGFGRIVKPNVSAPGVNVRSSFPTNGYVTLSGTSMAAPHVTGVVALVWAATPGIVGGINSTTNFLQNSARPRADTQCGPAGPPNNVYGWGIVNALAAVQASRLSFTFTDDPLSPQVIPVKAVHITELRQAINTLRSRRGLSPFSYADPTLTPGVTPIRAFHITDLRTALNDVYDAVRLPRPSYTDPTILPGQTVIKAAHIAEIRSAVRALK